MAPKADEVIGDAVDLGEAPEPSFLEDQNIVTKYKTAAEIANVRSFWLQFPRTPFEASILSWTYI